MARILTFVTGNAGKLNEVRAVLGASYEVRNVDIDLDEYQGGIEEIARKKCEAAVDRVEGPVMVEDTSLCFHALGDLPGPYIKWFLKELRPVGLHRLLAGFDDKSAAAVCCLAYSEGRGKPIHVVQGRCEGRIVSPRGEIDFGWDPCFEPLDTGKTFAEMSKSEKNVISHRSKALAALRKLLEGPQDENN